MRVDYIELVDWSTLLPVLSATPGTLFAVAAWVGKTRLIDNAIIALRTQADFKKRPDLFCKSILRLEIAGLCGRFRN